MTSRDLKWPEVTRKWRDLTGSRQEVAVEGLKLAYTVHFTLYKAVARRRRQSRDKKWRHMTSGDRRRPEVTSFDRKSPRSGCRRQKIGVYCTFHFLQNCCSQEEVTWQEMTSRDLRWPEVTSFDWKSPGSGCRRPKTGVYCTFHFLQGCSTQEEAVTWQEMTSRDLRWPEVTRKWRHLTGSYLEVVVEGRKLEYTVPFTSYKAVARRRRQSRDRKSRHVTSGDRKWHGSDVIWTEVTWKWL